MNDGIKRITISDIREIIESGGGPDGPFFSNLGFGVAPRISKKMSSAFMSSVIRMHEMRVGIIKEGRVEVNLNLIRHEMKKGDVIFIGRDVVFEALEISEDFDLMGVTVSDEVLKAAFYGDLPEVFNGSRSFACVHVEEEEGEMMKELVMLLWRTLYQRKGDEAVALSLVSTVFNYANFVICKREEKKDVVVRNRQQEIFDKFVALVNEYGAREHSVRFFADKLCLTEHYISKVVASVSGKTAKDWIEKAIVTSAEIQLRHSSKQVSEIAEELNFPNASFFCKFFKRVTGVTAMEYRKRG